MSQTGLSKKIERDILAAAEAILPAAWSLAQGIFRHPELCYQERYACRSLSEFLEGRGFKLTPRAGGIETAFLAENKGRRRGPRIAFLAEMDALPGLGHACGHHLIAASSAGAAAALGSALPSFSGSILVIGTPAEEGGAGKLRLCRAGVFKNLDAALLVHPDKRTEVFKRSLGVVELKFEFIGRAAHAAAEPEAGVNALDAVIQTFNAVALMRQQMGDGRRVHGIITDGGTAANIIPERAAATFLARGFTIKDTLELAERVKKCAQGAARATGARLRTRTLKDKMYAPYVPNRPLGEAFKRSLTRIGIEDGGGPEDEGMGSTDVGNAGLEVPILHPLMKVPGVKAGVHTPEFAKAASGPAGRTMLGQAIKALALTGAELFTNPDLLKEVKADHRGFLRRMRA